MEDHMARFGDEFDVASFVYSEDGPGEYTLLAMKVEATEGSPLARVGYRGEYTFIGWYDGDRLDVTDRWRRIEREITAESDDNLRRLLVAVETGEVGLDELCDTVTWTPAIITEVLR